MTKLELKTHPVWQDLTNILENLNPHALVIEHLEMCNYKICGYWDEQDKFYEEIILPHTLSTELVGSSLGMKDRNQWIRLEFILNIEANSTYKREQKIGELSLIYNENMEFVDENWQIDMDTLRMVAHSTI